MHRTTRPNILLVMADQLVPFMTGAYGNAAAITPHLDRLAETGVRFDAAYSPYPLCAPARAGLLTGRHASDLGCYDNAAVLHADEPTVAHHLSNVGYDTALSGKMHFIGPDQLHGFRHRLTTDVFPAGIVWVPNQDEYGRFPGGGHAHNYVPPQVGVRPWTKFLAYDEETQFRALEYLHQRASAPSDDPFFLVASFHHPHDPFHVTQELWDLYDGVDLDIPCHPAGLDAHYSAMDRWVNEAHETADANLDDSDHLVALRRAYLGLVTYVDRKVGELMAALDAGGLRSNTIVIFTSDHGDMLGERRMVQKRSFYEWSARVPLLVNCPDGRGAGREVATPTTLLDLAPTLLDLAEVDVDDRLPVDGATLMPLVDGEEHPDRVICSEYHVEKVKAPCFMARRGPYKYVYIHGHGTQLFDLERDPGEWDDRSDDPTLAGVRADLHTHLMDRFDPEAIAEHSELSVRQRLVIQRALAANGTHWDYEPRFDASRQYVR